MDIKQYQENTLNTCATLPTLTEDTAHMLYGMFSEIDELLGAFDRVNAGEELTDSLWYLSNYCNFYDIELSDHFEFKSNKYDILPISHGLEYDIHLIRCISKLSDWEKKSMAYKKPFSDEKRLELVLNIAKAINDCYAVRSLDPYQCMQNNIDKLRLRFPEKFDQERALNRNLAGERKILER
jgi:hypothetical protein